MGLRFIFLGVGIVLLIGAFRADDDRDSGLGCVLMLGAVAFICVAFLFH